MRGGGGGGRDSSIYEHVGLLTLQIDSPLRHKVTCKQTNGIHTAWAGVDARGTMAVGRALEKAQGLRKYTTGASPGNI